MLLFVLQHRSQDRRGSMLEEHSVGLIAASVASVVIYFFGLVVNFSNLALQYTSSTSRKLRVTVFSVCLSPRLST